MMKTNKTISEKNKINEIKSINKASEKYKQRNIGIYIHIPFCVSKCFYCDFVSFPGIKEEIKYLYVESLLKEIDDKSSCFGNAYEIDSIFIGGGTPTSIDSNLIFKILKKLNEKYRFSADIEITIESNPKTLSLSELKDYLSFGINRLSMGCQSFNDKILLLIGRSHTVSDFYTSYETARNSGFENINFDIIAALPGETPEMLQNDLEKALAINPEHISLYTLQLEEGTVLYEKYLKKEIMPVDEATDRIMYHDSVDFLISKGYNHYEISNFAKPYKECRHNLKYWNLEEYIGLGCAAHSYIDDYRMANIRDLDKYICALNKLDNHRFTHKNECKFREYEKEYIEYIHKNDMYDNIKEYMITALRKIKGFHKRDFKDRFGIDIDEFYQKDIKELISDGLIQDKAGQISLTSKGIDLSNSVLCRFV